jgi:hypothetical protein
MHAPPADRPQLAQLLSGTTFVSLGLVLTLVGGGVAWGRLDERLTNTNAKIAATDARVATIEHAASQTLQQTATKDDLKGIQDQVTAIYDLLLSRAGGAPRR